MITGIVLAAGTSSRLGRPKQLLELHGKPLLQHVVDTATAAPLDEIVVVLGYEADAVREVIAFPERARVVVNADFALGQSTSLRAGIDAAGASSDAVVIVLGDQPGVSAELIALVVQTWLETGAPIVRATFRGAPGHPVLFARSEWGALRDVGGDRGARDLLAGVPERVRDVEMGTDPPPDVDTWEQYERLIADGPG